MSEPATAPIADKADPVDGWERALLDDQLEALGRLAEMGMAIAASIQQRVTAEPPGSGADAVLHHAAMDFARVARAPAAASRSSLPACRNKSGNAG